MFKAFWGAYAEPVEDFVKAAVQLRKAPALLDDAADAGSQDLVRVRSGMDILHALTRTIGPTLLPIDGVLMALLSGGVFVTKAYQARYCTDRCRFTAPKRRHRARQNGKVK